MSESTLHFRHLFGLREKPDHLWTLMSPHAPGGKSILCVDDTPYVLQMLEMFLSAVGYRSLLASNGGQAISMALSKNPDAAILDYEMPNVNGIELAHILNERLDAAHRDLAGRHLQATDNRHHDIAEVADEHRCR